MRGARWQDDTNQYRKAHGALGAAELKMMQTQPGVVALRYDLRKK
jgi:hypothetical protein